jgi:hypothetical protein
LPNRSRSQQSNVLQFARRPPDSAIVGYLKDLLEQAERGNIVGIVAAVHHGAAEFGYVGAGTLVANPALGLGATLRLSQKLL